MNKIRGFTRDQMEDFMKFAVLAGGVTEGVPSITTEEENARIKAWAAEGLTIVDSIINRMTTEFAEQCIKDMRKYCMFLTMKGEPRKDERVISTDALDSILEYAFEQCAPCKCTNQKACKLRKALKKLNIPVYNEEARGCQYNIE